jgi:hypothetical protein
LKPEWHTFEIIPDEEITMQPNLTAVEIQLLKQLNERDSQVLDGRPRPLGADRLEELGYIKVHTLNLQDLLYSITPAGRTALAAIDPED